MWNMTRTNGLLLLFGAIAVWAVARWDGGNATEDERIIVHARQALTTGKAYRARQDSLQRVAAQRVQTVRARDRVIAQLDAQLAHVPTPRDSVRVLLMKVDTLTAQRDSLLSALILLGVRADSSESRVAALEHHLRGTLSVAECHVLGVQWLPRCPSRTASFLLGAGLTATLALARD